jgi:hypothetical protein
MSVVTNRSIVYMKPSSSMMSQLREIALAEVPKRLRKLVTQDKSEMIQSKSNHIFYCTKFKMLGIILRCVLNF